jgi:hypothetical protein
MKMMKNENFQISQASVRFLLSFFMHKLSVYCVQDISDLPLLLLRLPFNTLENGDFLIYKFPFSIHFKILPTMIFALQHDFQV